MWENIMRSSFLLAPVAALTAITLVACAEQPTEEATEVASSDRMNQMVPLIEQGLPIMGVIHTSYLPGRGETEGPDLAAAAAEMVAYQDDDFVLNNYSPRTAEQYAAFMEALTAAGGSAGTHPFLAKIPIIHDDPEGATQRMIEQLNAGQVAVAMQEVETVEEVEQTIAAMRFTSVGGTRPEEGFGAAAAYWGMSEDEYLEKADVWPLNPEGELLLTVIIESRDGAANARAIAEMDAVSVVIVGAGTLGGVFSSRNEAGERVRDQAGFDAAVAQILDACKEFGKVCGYPANNAEQVEELMAEGWDFFIMQRRNEDAFGAIAKGRELGGR